MIVEPLPGSHALLAVYWLALHPVPLNVCVPPCWWPISCATTKMKSAFVGVGPWLQPLPFDPLVQTHAMQPAFPEMSEPSTWKT